MCYHFIKQFYVPSMFRICWHKMYNCYHGYSFGMKLATHSTATIHSIVSWTREHCYCDIDSYKEVHVNDTIFYRDIKLFNSMKSDDYDLVNSLMIKIVNDILRGNSVLKYSIPLNVVDTINNVTEENDINDVTIDKMDNMGDSLQMECHLRQHIEENGNEFNIPTI